MRVIKIPARVLQECRKNWRTMGGRSVMIPVQVDWPELQLTEQQILANAAASVYGQSQPYLDRSLIDVEIPWEGLIDPSHELDI